MLEIVSEAINDAKKIDLLKNFCEDSLGKGVIICKDTPGFLGNRVGVYAMQSCNDRSHQDEIRYRGSRCSFWKTYGYS